MFFQNLYVSRCVEKNIKNNRVNNLRVAVTSFDWWLETLTDLFYFDWELHNRLHKKIVFQRKKNVALPRYGVCLESSIGC